MLELIRDSQEQDSNSTLCNLNKFDSVRLIEIEEDSNSTLCNLNEEAKQLTVKSFSIVIVHFVI